MNNGHSTGYSHLKGELDKEIQSLHICSSFLWKFCSLGFVRMSKYADDANFLVSDIQSLNCLFLTCTDHSIYRHYSSLRLNEEKSEASWIGSNRSNTSKPLSPAFVMQMVNLKNDKIKIFGCYSSYCKDLSEKYNFLEVINKLKTCFHV